MTHTSLRVTLILTMAIAPVTAVFAAGPVGPNITHGPITIDLQTVATGLTSPVDLEQVPGNPNQQLVLDQTGEVRLIDHGVLQPTPYMNLSPLVVPLMPGYDERGLLGLAFDPNYNTPGAPGFHTLYTYLTEPVNAKADFTVSIPANATMNAQNVLLAWNTDTMTSTELMRIDKPEFNHNGGTIAFGPDGDLYMGTGDGGNANDVGDGHTPGIGNAQDPTNALGKILRIDVHGNNSANGKYGIPADNPLTAPGDVKEIYAMGLRNPYRFSFDPATGRLIVADVGQNNIEEIDLVTKGGNYGWHLREGNHDFNPADGTVSATATPPPPGITDPIAEYDHVNGGIAVVGGFVYHGTAIPELDDKYVFGDFTTNFGAPEGRLFYMDMDGPDADQIHSFQIGPTDQPLGIYLKGFGEDANGEIYVLGSTTLGPTGTTGVVMKIVAVPEPAGLAAVSLATGLMLMRRRKKS